MRGAGAEQHEVTAVTLDAFASHVLRQSAAKIKIEFAIRMPLRKWDSWMGHNPPTLHLSVSNPDRPSLAQRMPDFLYFVQPRDAHQRLRRIGFVAFGHSMEFIGKGTILKGILIKPESKIAAFRVQKRRSKSIRAVTLR